MGNKTALIVDDSRSARFALRRHLEHHAYTVDTAESAEEAYQFLKAHRPEVIFLDHVMPGTDGFTALQHIKQDPETGTIPVVICSSNEGVDFNAEAMAKGATDVLQKPPTPEQLTRVLENLQQFSATLKTVTRTEVPPPAPAAGAKVTNLREPDVTIGQAVMNVLRNTLHGRNEHEVPSAAPLPVASAPVPPPAPPAPAPVIAAAVPPSVAVAPAAPAPTPAAPAPAEAHQLPGALREQLETRLKKLTQDVFHQVSEIKANLAVVESRLRDPDEDRELLEAAAKEGIRELQERVEFLESRIDARFGEMQQRIESLLEQQAQELRQALQRQMHEHQERLTQAQEAQDRRIEQVVEQARVTASEEAHAASERTVMSAAARIADQLADSILKALGRK